MDKITRRAAIGAAMMTAASYRRVMGANSRPRAGIIGLGARGGHAHVPAALELPVDISAVCDVDKPKFDNALSLIHAKGAPPPATYTDYRKILDRGDIDVVFIATPEHWHAIMAVDACKAGKDVYVEKPLAHTPEECMAIVAAARQYNRVVQVGLQQRSMKVYFDALNMLRSGAIGKVEQCETAWGYSGSVMHPPEPATAPPDGFDWDAFQGPAPRHAYQASRQKGWHGYWDYGTGPISDVGVHVMDVARWFLDLDMPQLVQMVALPAPAPEQVPYVVDGIWKYDGALVTYSSRKEDMTDLFWAQEGTLFVNRAVIRTEKFGARNRPGEKKEFKVDDPGFESVKIPNVRNAIVHIQNFLECVQSRKTPNAPPEVGAKSTIACLLGARSIRTGHPCMWDGAAVKDL